MVSKEEQIAWASGFWIGDGTISTDSEQTVLILSINQIDRKPLDVFQNIFNCGQVSGPHKSPNKDLYTFKCSNTKGILYIVNQMWDYLFLFRKKQVYTVLNNYYGNTKIKRKNLPNFKKEKWVDFDENIYVPVACETLNENLALASGLYSAEGSCSYIASKKEGRNTGSLQLTISQIRSEPLEHFKKFILNPNIKIKETHGNHLSENILYILATSCIETVKLSMDRMWSTLSDAKKEQYLVELSLYENDQKNKFVPEIDFNIGDVYCKNKHLLDSSNIFEGLNTQRCRSCCKKRRLDKKSKSQ